MTKLPKLVVIVGCTASGKTDLAIRLAKEFNGEIVSADSRQVYKKMNIGTAKPDGKWMTAEGKKVYMVEGVPHFLMDILKPGDKMTSARFKELAFIHITDIHARGKLPIMVGGTGQYIWAVVDNLEPPPVAPNKKMRQSLASKTLEELQTLLKRLDPVSFSAIDLDNPRRLLRALEVAIVTGESFTKQKRQAAPLFDILQIGVRRSLPELTKRIERRLGEQIIRGLAEETKNLVRQKFGWNLPSMSSIGYRQMGSYLEGECTLAEAKQSIIRETRRYAKRQIVWFKRDRRIQWIEGSDATLAAEVIKKFLNKK